MATDIKIQLTKVINASRTRVFSAWKDPQVMQQWFAPRDLAASNVRLDFRVGGSYSIEMHGAVCEGLTHTKLEGIYKKIIPNELLVFTFKGTCSSSGSETLVTVEFRDHGNGTELTLTHEHASTMEDSEGFKVGWTSTLAKLDRLLGFESSILEQR